MAEHTVSHSIRCAGPPDQAYRLVADVTLWPIVFGPTVAVDVLHRNTDGEAVNERFRITAAVDDQVRTWTSTRELNSTARTIDFRQEHARAPIDSMSGTWSFDPADGDGTQILLRHRFRLTDDRPDNRAWMEAALDTNSERELGAIAAICAAEVSLEDLVVRCTDSVRVDDIIGAYQAVSDARSWPALLSHVYEVDLTEPEPGIQDLQMTVRTVDGVEHRTRSIRLCEPGRRISYKQLRTPVGLSGHSGCWGFDEETGNVTSSHIALLDPKTVTSREHAAQLRETVATTLSTNSRATLAALTRAPLLPGIRS
ncbi:SRPBCC family protein [Nocardia salmonicida]|uniref:SRPBCC family protein n=1 Tax=Nocardia salmonicida TaxID=53431 RepID=A0ABZ1N0I6_9NOCA